MAPKTIKDDGTRLSGSEKSQRYRDNKKKKEEKRKTNAEKRKAQRQRQKEKKAAEAAIEKKAAEAAMDGYVSDASRASSNRSITEQVPMTPPVKRPPTFDDDMMPSTPMPFDFLLRLQESRRKERAEQMKWTVQAQEQHDKVYTAGMKESMIRTQNKLGDIVKDGNDEDDKLMVRALFPSPSGGNLSIIPEGLETMFNAAAEPAAMPAAMPAANSAPPAPHSGMKPKRDKRKAIPLKASRSPGAKKMKSAGKKTTTKPKVFSPIEAEFVTADLKRGNEISLIDKSMPEKVWEFDLRTHIESISQDLEGEHKYYLVGHRDLESETFVESETSESKTIQVPFFHVHAIPVDEELNDPDHVYVDTEQRVSVSDVEYLKRRIGSKNNHPYYWKQVSDSTMCIKILHCSTRRNNRSVGNMNHNDKLFAASAKVWFPQKFNVNSNLLHGFALRTRSGDVAYMPLTLFKGLRNAMLKELLPGKKKIDASYNNLDQREQMRQLWNEILFNHADEEEQWVDDLLQTSTFVDGIMDRYEEQFEGDPGARDRVEAEVKRTLKEFRPTMIDMLHESELYDRMTARSKHFKIYPENTWLHGYLTKHVCPSQREGNHWGWIDKKPNDFKDSSNLKYISSVADKAQEIYPIVFDDDGGGKPKAK